MMERTLGEQLAISVGTAIPLEEQGLAVSSPVPSLWLNLQTLFRNYYEAYEDPERVPREQLITGFNEEMTMIHHLLDGMVEAVVFMTQNTYLPKLFPYAKVKQPRTPKQRVYAAMEAQSLHHFLSHTDIPVLRCQQRLPGENRKAWIMTHHPLNLISQYEFSTLTLLNSHTGELKPPRKWIGKLTHHDAYQKLPFNLLTLQVLGDGAHQFLAQPPTIKRAMLSLAEEKRWKPTTTRDKILTNLKLIEDDTIKDMFRAMLLTKLK